MNNEREGKWVVSPDGKTSVWQLHVNRNWYTQAPASNGLIKKVN